MKDTARHVGVLALVIGCLQPVFGAEEWLVDKAEDWQQARKNSEGLQFDNGGATLEGDAGAFESIVKRFPTKRFLQSITFKQSPEWFNWEPIGDVGPSNLGDGPVLLCLGPHNYWMFGRYKAVKGESSFTAEAATLEGFDVPLKTTPFPHQFDAPGGLKKGLRGYHAWQSRDMVNWVHHGPVTEFESRWVTTAEYVDGKAYIYYDNPNDQDPHLFIDEDLTDGKPGTNVGMVFKDPSHGSDCSFIRELDGTFHVIYENWDPINAREHAWDSPLAGHAVSPDGIHDFKILPPAVDERTTPTGKTGTYEHPHWLKHPDWDTNIGEYEIHEPEQNAYGDWAAISIGGQYYLFCDDDPAGGKIRVGWFTSPSLDQQFTYCGSLLPGHPDPDIGFAEGKFYLVTQTSNDYVSPGPWVDQVEARAGVDTDNDGKIDVWTDWQEVREHYDYIKGFAKQIACDPATLDVGGLPQGYGFGFQFRTEAVAKSGAKPVIERVSMSFE